VARLQAPRRRALLISGIMRFLLPLQIGFFFFTASHLLLAQKRPPATVLVAEAKREAIANRIEAIGTLRAAESVELTATVSERVVETGFEDGDRVERGRVLVRLSATEEEALHKEAASSAREAKLQYERIAQLAERGTASISQLDEARRIHETAKARQLAIESRLAELVIKAPFDGVVGLRNISVGAVVRPGDLITTVDDDTSMLLDFTVPATFLAAVEAGSTVEATTSAFGAKPFQGAVRSVSSRIDPVTRAVMVRAEIPNTDRLLKPGMLMTVNLLNDERQSLLIPEGALLPVGKSHFVMVVDQTPAGTAARRVEVRIGLRIDGSVEILSGLSEGDAVVAHGAFKLADGAAVRVLPKPAGADNTEELQPERN